MAAESSPDPRRALPVPPKLRSTTVFGRTVRYYDVGQGRPLVLIHGMGGDADEWALCFSALRGSHRVIALDMLGFGRSDKPLLDYCIAFFVEALDHFLRSLGIERPTLVGSSLGGWVAAAFALESPASVDNLILVDAAGVWHDPTILLFDLRVSTRAHMREILEQVFFDKSLVTEELIDLAYNNHLERGDGYTIDRLMQNLRDGREHLDAAISSLQTPTMIVWGEQDALIPAENGRRMQQLITGSILKVIPQCGHLPALEKPAEFARFVLEFLAR
jgi:2-hydroxy-6-oxonona-2,4-dienedioate hydrolase